MSSSSTTTTSTLSGSGGTNTMEMLNSNVGLNSVRLNKQMIQPLANSQTNNLGGSNQMMQAKSTPPLASAYFPN